MTTTAAAPATAAPAPVRERTLWRDAVNRFKRNRLAVGGFVIVALFVLMALFAGIIAPTPYDYSVLAEALQFPSRQHWMGTDAVGRDFFSRIVYGARTSLGIALAVMSIAFAIGVPLGAIAGLRGGRVDFFIMRLVEVMTAFPSFLFALFLMSILGAGVENVVLALSITSWIDVTRLTRAQILSLREREFVTAAQAYGASERQIVVRHLMPGALPPLVVMFMLGIPSVMFAEAGLSFLGVGINDPIPSWGKMVGESLNYVRVYWHLGIFPTLAIALAMLSFNFMGDGLRDALDPTMTR
jgi:oligopeptide transport system permease protein